MQKPVIIEPRIRLQVLIVPQVAQTIWECIEHLLDTTQIHGDRFKKIVFGKRGKYEKVVNSYSMCVCLL